MTKWPSEEQLKKVRKRLSKTSGTRIVTNEFNYIDLLKRDLCAELIIYQKEHKITQRELSKQLDVSEALVSKLTRYQFDEFTVDRLMRYLSALGIKYEFRRVA